MHLRRPRSCLTSHCVADTPDRRHPAALQFLPRIHCGVIHRSVRRECFLPRRQTWAKEGTKHEPKRCDVARTSAIVRTLTIITTQGSQVQSAVHDDAGESEHQCKGTSRSISAQTMTETPSQKRRLCHYVEQGLCFYNKPACRAFLLAGMLPIDQPRVTTGKKIDAEESIGSGETGCSGSSGSSGSSGRSGTKTPPLAATIACLALIRP